MKNILLILSLIFCLDGVAKNTIASWTPNTLNLTSAGTAQALSATAKNIRNLLIEAPAANTGNIFIANSSANASGTKRHTLAPGDTLSLEADFLGGKFVVFDLADIFFDGATTNDDIVFSFFN